MKKLKHVLILVAFGLLNVVCVSAAEKFISFTQGDLKLCKTGDSFSICISDNDNIAVKLAARNLASDFQKVCDANVTISSSDSEARIIAGTIGNSAAIDQLVKSGKIDAKSLNGKIEKYILNIIDGKLIIAGSDRRGTVYGIYELSRQIGVSPWYYWMDVPVKKQKEVYVKNGTYTDGEPAVRYRGLFLNDEAPCLTSWVKNTFGTEYGGHKFYEKVFELVLRLKGNYMWPAMWGWAFYADDPLNMKTADDMGIMMGTSHHEPMCRAQKEWHNHSDNPNADSQDLATRKKEGKDEGNHEWNYATNKKNLDKFWYGGVERNKHTEDIITIGMRGDGDMAMSEDRNLKLMESIVANQRKLISKARGKAAKDVPQVWALYKEVLDYYDDGMRVPDDVTILLCDDNWGNVRRVPTMKERQRKGGWGLYYHVDYVGAPRNTKTLNVTPIQNMWEQLSLAYENGIQKLWILNVGDLKPMEYPIQLFMDMAWNYGKSKEGVKSNIDNISTLLDHTKDFCSTFVGESEAEEATRILNMYCKLAGRCTPEMLDARTYNLETGEWAKVVDEHKTLEVEALRQSVNLPAEAKDAYFQSILFPIQLLANLHQMYYAQEMTNSLHQKGDAAMNDWADKCEMYFKRDGKLMAQYNKEIAGGKWDGMMTQKHIGYRTWNDDFKADKLPRLFRTEGKIQNIFEEDGKGYIAMEAEHFNESTSPLNAKWTVLPYVGRTLSGVTLLPVTEDVKGGSLTYKFRYDSKDKNVTPTVYVVVKSTLDYLNKGGMTYSLAFDGGKAEVVNFNENLNEDPKNIYTVYYPTIARRVIEKKVTLPLGSSTNGIHSLTFTPNDPGIVLEKIVIDFGGYKKQYLYGEESLRK